MGLPSKTLIIVADVIQYHYHVTRGIISEVWAGRKQGWFCQKNSPEHFSYCSGLTCTCLCLSISLCRLPCLAHPASWIFHTRIFLPREGCSELSTKYETCFKFALTGLTSPVSFNAHNVNLRACVTDIYSQVVMPEAIAEIKETLKDILISSSRTE